MNLKQLISFLLSICLIVFLQSCGSSSSDKEKNSEEFKAAEESLPKQIEEVVYNIPPPAEIPYLIQATGADFNQSLLNPRSKADQYLTRNDKAALNLGVYATDIGYLSSYDKTQEAIDYLTTCKSLAENLNVIGSFDVDMLKRFEKNIANKDSLALLINASIDKADYYLKSDNRSKLAAQVIAGSFIEGLYISTGLVKSYPKDLPDDARNLVLTPVISTVLKQKESVSEVRKMLGTVEKTDLITSLDTELGQLEKAYAGLNIEEQIKNNRADLVLTDKNLTEITNIVDRMRNLISE
ncbi:MAG TPA: hypothetical protein VFW11_05050 [Cyclobacteriaceae bacterium]|nr:hypothetical protein [Cyclobacteriaceae bacterium]